MELKIKEFINKHKYWENELNQLRFLITGEKFDETVKWGMPTYTIHNENIIGIGAFKNHLGLWFHQGALIDDKYNQLRNAQEGKTKAMRSIVITKDEPIDEKVVLYYIKEAKKNASAGRKVAIQKKPLQVVEIPPLLQQSLDKDKELHKAFQSLTKVMQRDYAIYINEAKRERTKISRLEKILPLIQDRKPLSSLWNKC